MKIEINKLIRDNLRIHLNSTLKFKFKIQGSNNVVVDIVDGYTNLVFWKSQFKDINFDIEYFVESPYNVKHSILNIYDLDTNRLLHSSEYIDGEYEIKEKYYDKYRYIMDSNNIFKSQQIALPLYEIFLDKLYDSPFLMDEMYPRKVIPPLMRNNVIEEGDVVVDIGANIGLFSLYALNQGCKEVYAVEPIPEACNIIRQIIKLNSIDNLYLDECALSNKTGFEKFIIGSEYMNMIESCLVSSTFSEYAHSTDKKIEVKTVNFMDWINQKNIKQIDYLKCDTEGSEYCIFESMDDEYLKNNIKKIVLEYHGIPKNYERLISSITDKFDRCGFDWFAPKSEIDADSNRVFWERGGMMYAINRNKYEN
jgi:FkbM family methyltransferase